MAIPQLTSDMNIVSALDNRPNAVGGLSADELKAVFDSAGNLIKTYLNETLIPFINSFQMAGEVGIETVPGITGATTVQEALASLEMQLQNMTQGAVADGSIDNAKLADGAVIATKIAALAVQTVALADGAVTAAKLAAGSVVTEKIAEKAVTNAKLGDGSVGTTKLGSKSVTTAKIADAAVGSTQIDAAAVTEPKLGAEAVSTRTIKGAAVTTPKIASGAVTRTKLAADAKYSLIMSLAASRAIALSDLGTTLSLSNANVDFDLTLAKTDTDNWPVGYEVAVYWNAAKTAKITASGGLYFANEDAGVLRLNGVATLNGNFAMVALKKVTNTTFLVTGSAEVTAP